MKDIYNFDRNENTGKALVCTRFGIGVRDNNWFKHRLLLLESISIPSFKNQKTKDFIWCFFIDNEIDINILQRVDSLLKTSGINYYIYTKPYSKESINNLIDDLKVTDNSGYALTCRMDDDDALHPETFNKIFSYIEDWRNLVTKTKDGVALTFPRGIEWVMYDQIDIWKRDAGVDHIEEAACREFYRPFMGTSCFMYSLKSSGLTFLDISHANASVEENAKLIDTIEIETDEYMWLYARHKQSDSGITKAKTEMLDISLPSLCHYFGLNKDLVEEYIDTHNEYGYLSEKKVMSKRMRLQNKINSLKSKMNTTTSSPVDNLEHQLLEISSDITVNGLQSINKSSDSKGMFTFSPIDECNIDTNVRLVIYDYDLQVYSLIQEIDCSSSFSISKDSFQSKQYKYKYQIKTNEGKWYDLFKYKKLSLLTI